jgi:hypothetical protein
MHSYPRRRRRPQALEGLMGKEGRRQGAWPPAQMTARPLLPSRAISTNERRDDERWAVEGVIALSPEQKSAE